MNTTRSKWILYAIVTACVLFQLAKALCSTDKCSRYNYDRFLCNCAYDAPCDNKTGACPADVGCADGWFGSSCQYATSKFTARDGPNNLHWLTDDNDRSCNNGSEQSITITLDTPIFLTWMRIHVVMNSAQKDEVLITYDAGGTSKLCPTDKVARVDDTTLDFSCPTSEVVGELTVSGSGIGSLCSLYISGGRNVALNMDRSNMAQSSVLHGDYYEVSKAVNGLLSRLDDYSHYRCFRTNQEPAAPAWWTLTFPTLITINNIDVYNYRARNLDWLMGFTLNIYDENDANVFNFTDEKESTSFYYNISSVGVRHAKKIEVLSKGDTLNICEIVVFGDYPCENGKYGQDCQHSCNCAYGHDCLDHSGGCPSGCAPGYTGEDCLALCPKKTYGNGCRETCSINCVGDGTCDHIDGSCDEGCTVGYMPPLCEQECPKGSYGQNCLQTCSEHCIGEDRSCHHITGFCDLGCEAGYQPGLCSEECLAGYYGQNCRHTCNEFCAGYNDSCNHVTGSCDLGCEQDYQPPLCEDSKEDISTTSDGSEAQGEKKGSEGGSADESDHTPLIIIGAVIAGLMVVSVALAVITLIFLTKRLKEIKSGFNYNQRKIVYENPSAIYSHKDQSADYLEPSDERNIYLHISDQSLCPDVPSIVAP